MKKLLILLIAITITLSLFPAVLAATDHTFVQIPSSNAEGFLMTSTNSKLSMCSCSTGTDFINVVNTGGAPVKVDLSANLDYVSFSSSSVNLIPGESEKVYVYIHAPCDKSSDDLEITGESIYGSIQILEKTLDFKNCDNLLVIASDDFNTTICKPFQDSFVIQNTGSFAEQYAVSVNSFEQYSSVAKKIITIPAKTSFEYVVTYVLPCDISGVNELSYTVDALKNDRTADFSKNILITPDYDFNVFGPEEISVCDSQLENYTLKFENLNHFSDKYLITLNAPSFVDIDLPKTNLGLESNVLLLDANSFTNIPLTVSPSKEKHSGVYNISITMKSLTGDVYEGLIIPLNVTHCFDFSNILSVPFKDLNLCADDTKLIDLVLEHKGYSPAVVDLEINSSDYIDLISDAVVFKGKEGKKVSLLVDDAPDAFEESQVVIDAYFAGNLVGSDSFNVKLNNRSTCYGAFASDSNIQVQYDAKKVYVDIKNYGEKDGYYNIDVDNLPNYLTLDSDTFGLESGDDLTLTFSINQTKLSNAAGIYNNASIVGLTGSFLLRLERTSGQEFNSKINVEFVENPWYVWMGSKAYNWWVAKDICTQMFLVFFFLAALFFLIAFVKFLIGRQFRSANILGLVLLVLVIIALLAVFSWKGVPSRDMFYSTYNLETNSTVYLKLEEDRTNSFDLTNFFYDPDNNIESYVVEIENGTLTSKVKGDKLVLESTKDWNGLTYIDLTAIDSDGASASSGAIFVEVLPVEDYSFWEFFKMACVYFNLVMFAIASFFLYLVFSFQKGFREVKDEKQLTLIETVVVKKEKVPKQDVILNVTKGVRENSSTKKSSVKRTPKKFTKNMVKKSTKKTVKSSSKKSSKSVSKPVKKTSKKSATKSVASKKAVKKAVKTSSNKQKSKPSKKETTSTRATPDTVSSNVNISDFKVENP